MTAIAYSEPYKIPAGAMALLVHGVFFMLLYTGFNWHTQKPENLEVALWSSLPEAQTESQLPASPAPVPKPVVVTPTVSPPKVVAPKVAVKADIELKEKKSKKTEKKLPDVKKMTMPDRKRQEKEQTIRAAQQDERVQAQRNRMRAELEESMAGEVGKYQDMIRTKIRRNITMPPDVPADSQAEFVVILLPGGEVSQVTLTKSSGIAAYDSAVEHAILKARILPVPKDADLARMFRELHLTLKPE
jgi:colicin import membrane protein